MSYWNGMVQHPSFTQICVFVKMNDASRRRESRLFSNALPIPALSRIPNHGARGIQVMGQ